MVKEKIFLVKIFLVKIFLAKIFLPPLLTAHPLWPYINPHPFSTPHQWFLKLSVTHEGQAGKYKYRLIIIKEAKTCFTSSHAIDVTYIIQRTTSGKVPASLHRSPLSTSSRIPLIILTGSLGPGSGQSVIWCRNVGQPLVFPRSGESCVWLLLRRVPEYRLELQTNHRQIFTITEKAPIRALSWLKVPTRAIRFKTLC